MGIFGYFGFAMVLVLLTTVLAGVIAFQRGQLTFLTLVHIYTAALFTVCLFLVLLGGALLIKTLASAVIARDFSYQTVDFPRGLPPGVSNAPLPTSEERARMQAGNDLTTGITLLMIGGGLGIPHAIANRAVSQRDARGGGSVERGQMIAMLALSATVGLVSSINLVNDVLRRYVITTAPDAYSQPHPGEALGFTLMFVPVWIYSAYAVWRNFAQAETRAEQGAGHTEATA